MKSTLLFIYVLLFSMCTSFGQTIVGVKTLPLYEGFNYDVGTKLLTEGAIEGQGFWQVFNANAVAATGANPILVDSPIWSMGGLPAKTTNSLNFSGGGDDPVLNFTDQGTSFAIYASFVFRIATPDTDLFTTTSGDYIFSFGKTSASNAVNYTSNVYIKKTSAASTSFNIGIAENNSTSIVAWSPTVFNYDQDIVVVIKYATDGTIAGSLSSMWINPVITGTEPTPTLTTATSDALAGGGGTAARTNIDKIRINKSSNAGTPNLIIDEIRVANTWWQTVGQSDPNLELVENQINGLNIYPNPVNNSKLFINSISNDNKSVVVYDLLGRQILKSEVTSGILDVSNLIRGAYILIITEGGKTSIKKIIVN